MVSECFTFSVNKLLAVMGYLHNVTLSNIFHRICREFSFSNDEFCSCIANTNLPQHYKQVAYTYNLVLLSLKFVQSCWITLKLLAIVAQHGEISMDSRQMLSLQKTQGQAASCTPMHTSALHQQTLFYLGHSGSTGISRRPLSPGRCD